MTLYEKMKRIILILSILIALTACKKNSEEEICNDFPLENSTLKDYQEYEIINSILENYYSNAKFIHIVQETSLYWSVGINGIKDRLDYENIEHDSLLIANYSRNNEKGYFLTDTLLIKSAQLINPKEIDCLFADHNLNWRKYYNKYPNSIGFFTFSRPSFNAQGNEAIIEYGWISGSLSGMGYLVILEKINDNWIITKQIETLAVKTTN